MASSGWGGQFGSKHREGSLFLKGAARSHSEMQLEPAVSCFGEPASGLQAAPAARVETNVAHSARSRKQTAGKTESQKYVLRYLCLSGSQSGRLEQLILEANPILEAFGNAKTIRNNNSSRFGKFIEIHYSARFQVTGGQFFHYLLEKSRICSQSAGERNYHIFYQLCACLPQAQWAELQLGSPDAFRYLSAGCTQYFGSRPAPLAEERQSASQRRLGSIADQLIDDFKCYQQTDRALTNFGLDERQKLAVYGIVAAVLHLGNIDFCDDHDDNRGGCRLEARTEPALRSTARLIGLEPDLLRQALVSRIMSTARGGHKGTVYMVQLSRQQAQAARDALAKAIYSKLFDHIVARIVDLAIPRASSSYYIGVLDVAGFEYFQHNDFEQFLINFCNERLQQFFNERILKEEQNIYETEGLNLERVEFVDNQDCIELFEARSAGIFDLLDEESRLPKPSAQHFTQSVHAANRAHFRLALPRASKLRAHREIRDDEGFLVRHFAGAVCYETHAFIEKNNDALHASLRSLMLEADNGLIRELFGATSSERPAHPQRQQQQQQQLQFQFQSGLPGAGGAQNKLNFVSVGTTFRSQLGELMGKLRSTGSHFIRCIKPNGEMVARKLEGGQILGQLHCSGMDSVLRLMQQGYPSRISFNDLYQAYSAHLPPRLARLDAHLFCRALFKAVGLAERDFRFGASKVFFKPAKFAQFDQLVRTSDADHMGRLVGRVSRWLVGARWRKAQYCALSAVKLVNKILYRRQLIVRLQKNWRAALVRRRLRFRLEALRGARQIAGSLAEFEQIVVRELRQPAERARLEEESRQLRNELAEFVAELGRSVRLLAAGDPVAGREVACGAQHQKQQAAAAAAACHQRLDLLRSKRDRLLSSIRDKIARQQKELAALERQLAEERATRQAQELARRQEEQLKLQRNELELRRQTEAQLELAQRGQPAMVDSATDPISLIQLQPLGSRELEREQERRDYQLAMRLARERDDSETLSQSSMSPPGAGAAPARAPVLAPGENLAQAGQLKAGLNLTKWKYSDLRDAINTSCDLELLEACKREFHRRLKVYHAWRAMNSSQRLPDGPDGSGQPAAAAASQRQMRAPSCIMNQSAGACNELTLAPRPAGQPEQRYFRIPFLRAQAAGALSGAGPSQRGWWFAHFDGQWIARQLELHPNREPILLLAGQHDIDMCELSLDETRLTSKRGAEILAHEFEAEWRRHGGQPYTRQQRPLKQQ